MKLIESLREKAGKATPGKWEAGCSTGGISSVAYHVYDASNRHIAECSWHENSDKYFPVGVHAAEANASLIAACSPEVILALCDAAEALKRIHRPHDQLLYHNRECPTCAALAKLEQK